jgi:hypothetical protein
MTTSDAGIQSVLDLPLDVEAGSRLRFRPTPRVDIEGPDKDLFAELWKTYEAKRSRNLIRSAYYDMHSMLKDFGISIPPRMRKTDVAVGWIGRGIHALTDRSILEGFVTPDDSEDAFGLNELMFDNDFIVEFPQATVSSAVHACSFITVGLGDEEAGEPQVLIRPRAADDSAATWDSRRRRLSGFLAIVDADKDGKPKVIDFYTPETIYTLTKVGGKWFTESRPHGAGEVPVSVLRYKPSLKRPLGRSRITRAAMYYTDAAVRTILRSEVSAEFYSATEYWLFGANVQEFIGDDKWSAIMGRIKALDVEEGETPPTLQRFEGSSPTPHTEQLRMFATLYAGEMGLSLSQLGIVQDNPASADAMYAAKEDLITDARHANLVWGRGAVKAMQLAVRVRDDLPEVTPEMKKLSAQFTDPAIVSPSSAADAFTKRASAIPGFASSEVGLESAGLTREQIIRFRAEMRRASAGSIVESLRAQPADPELDAAAAATGSA